jgi:hypothetical protein
MTREEQIKQEAREATLRKLEAVWIAGNITKSHEVPRALYEVADSILSLKTDDWSIGIVDEKAGLPERIYTVEDQPTRAQQDMLKAGYRKII